MRGKQLSLIAQAEELKKAFAELVNLKTQRLSAWNELLHQEKYYLLLIGRVPDHRDQPILPSEELLLRLKSTIISLKGDQVIALLQIIHLKINILLF